MLSGILCLSVFVMVEKAELFGLVMKNWNRLERGETIARALLKDAPVILLDEATASLDVDNETEIQKAISGLVKGKTVLVIAHRMRTVEKVRRINKEYHHGNQP